MVIKLLLTFDPTLAAGQAGGSWSAGAYQRPLKRHLPSTLGTVFAHGGRYGMARVGYREPLGCSGGTWIGIVDMHRTRQILMTAKVQCWVWLAWSVSSCVDCVCLCLVRSTWPISKQASGRESKRRLGHVSRLLSEARSALCPVAIQDMARLIVHMTPSQERVFPGFRTTQRTSSSRSNHFPVSQRLTRSSRCDDYFP